MNKTNKERNKKGIVYVVEDNYDLRSLIEEKLEGEYCVVSFPKGEDFIYFLRERFPHSQIEKEIIILDMSLGFSKNHGEDILNYLKKEDLKIKTIILSGISQYKKNITINLYNQPEVRVYHKDIKTINELPKIVEEMYKKSFF